MFVLYSVFWLDLEYGFTIRTFHKLNPYIPQNLPRFINLNGRKFVLPMVFFDFTVKPTTFIYYYYYFFKRREKKNLVIFNMF